MHPAGPILAVFLALAGAPAPAQPAQPPSIPAPPADPAGLTRLTLSCGLEVWVHPLTTTREVACTLVLPAGSLAETDTEPGAAYLAKRLAGLGTPRVPPESLATFRSRFNADRLLDPGAGEHAAVNHETVIYTLVSDADGPDALDTALTHYADLLSGWQIDPARVDPLKPGALERRDDAKPEEIARRLFMPDLLGHERLGQCEIIPTDLATTEAEAVQAFIDRTYRAAGAHLIIVGAVDPAQALKQATVAFDAVPPRAATPPSTPAVRTGVAGRVSVHAIEDYDPAEVALLTIRPADPQSDPARQSVLDDLAAELVAPRVRAAAAMAEPGVVSVDTVAKAWVDATRIAEVSVRVDPAGVSQAGHAVATELARIAREPFTPEESRSARAALLAAYERDAAGWTTDPDAVLMALAIAARDPDGFVPPPDRLSHASRVLAETTDDTLTRHAAAVFAPDQLACILLTPEPQPDITSVTARGLLATAAFPPQTARPTVPDRLAALGTPGSIAAIAHHQPTGVWSATLANGVVVRARRTPADVARVRLTLCDGVPREDAATLGRTRDAVAAWAYARTNAADAGQLRAWCLDRGLSFKFTAGDHAVTLAIDAPPDAPGVTDALTLAAALLTEPGADRRYLARLHPADPDYGPAMRRLGQLMFPPNEPRARGSAPTAIIDAALADEWLARLALAPLEVSIVADLPPEPMLESAAATLGTLTPRPEPSRDRARPWGDLPRVEATERMTAAIDRPEVVTAVVFGDATDLATVRPMLAASQALGQELARLRDASELPARTRAWVWLGDGIPARASLVVRAELDPGADPDAVLSAIDAAAERVASGQTDTAVIETELARARKSVARSWDHPEFWADRLAALSSSGLGMDTLGDIRAAYDAITPEQVRRTLARALAEGVHKRVIVTPE
jgi:predicted Zn-dependent peptidase